MLGARWMLGFWVVAMVTVWSSRDLVAQPAGPVTGSSPVADGPAPEATTGAPLPGSREVSGVVQAEARGMAPALRWVPRVLLFVPRWAFYLASQPVRGAAWAYERFDIRLRAREVFFNDAETFGVYPTAFREAGFGLHVGGRMIVRDVFGAGEGLKARVGYGGRFRQLYALSLSTGERFGRLEFDLDAEFDIRDKDRFYGIGNRDRVDPADLGGAPPLIDALADDTAVATRFRQDVGQINLGTGFEVRGGFSVNALAGVLWRSFGQPGDAAGLSDDAVGNVYDLDSLVGFDGGLSAVQGELEVAYDSRRPASRYIARSVHSTGWRLAGYAGLTRGFGGDESSYTRYGVDLQRYIDLYHGTRILALRFFAEGVSGSLENIPFVDLPRLGGAQLLRGYDSDRFRDRAMTVFTAEYEWDLSSRVYSFFFVDVGRVWRSFRAIDGAGLQDSRVGFGGGLQILSMKSFLARLSLSTSIDGGLFVNFSFDPAYDRLSRRRK